MQTTNELYRALGEVGIEKDRVRNSFPQYVNSRVDWMTMGMIDEVSTQGSGAVTHRIEQLDEEWDIDRALLMAFGIIGGSTFLAGLTRNRKFMFLFGAQMSFLVMHAVKGWCPPASVMRRMGFRTQREIQAERKVLVNSMSGEGTQREVLKQAV